jgi:hypothetical protein
MGSFTGLSFGGGPVAMAAAVFLFIQALLLGMLFIKIVLPFAVVLISTLGCAILAGYRFFRWMRWVGLAVNVAAACYCLFVTSGEETQQIPTGLRMGFILFFLLNSFLFFAVPKQPDVQKSRRVIAWAHFALLLCIVIPTIPLIVRYAVTTNFNLVTTIEIVFILILYGIPFALNFRATRKINLSRDSTKIILPIIVSLVIMVLGWLTAPVLAIPVGISLLLFMFFLEMLFLYPEQYPQRRCHIYLVMLLGRLPQKPAWVGVRQANLDISA